ncbi:MAG: hypothetical protein EBZ48_17165 [Proteobacteria bacterium]|nr:hypothetical protein [Pseudomonadota bacterium]
MQPRPIQYFSKDYLAECRKLTPTAIAKYLEEFRLLQAERDQVGPSKLISLKVPQRLLKAFRGRCELEGVRYQTKMKALMREWLAS